MDPPISLLNGNNPTLDFHIEHQQEAVEDLEEVRKKEQELEEAVANEFDDLGGFSDDDDYASGHNTEESGYLQTPQMGYVGAASTPITEGQNYQNMPFQATPGYTMAMLRSNQHIMSNAAANGDTGHHNVRDMLDGAQIPRGHQGAYMNGYGRHHPAVYGGGGGDTGNFVAGSSNSDHMTPQQTESGSCSSKTDQYVQLQVMYKARMREVERLSMELENVKQTAQLEISSLREDLNAAKAQQENLLESLNQAHQVISDKSSESAELTVKVTTLESQLEIEKNNYEEAIHKMQVAESTIKMLQEQLSQLNQSDALLYIKKDYENVIRNMKEKNHEELYSLNQQIAQMNKQLTSKIEEVQRLKKKLEEQEKLFEAKLLEKSDIINRLTQSLNFSQKQCQDILAHSTGPSRAKDDFLQQMKQLEDEREAECQKIKFLEEELFGLQKLFVSPSDKDRNLGFFLEATQRSGCSSKMKLDINEAVFMIKMCRQEVTRLQGEYRNTSQALEAASKELNELRKKSRLSEDEVARLQEKLQGRDGSETESQFQDLKHDELVRQIKVLEQKIRDMDDSYQKAKRDEASLRAERESLLYTCAAEKAQAVDICKDSILEMHHAAMKRLREELLSLSEQEKLHLAQEYETRIKDMTHNYDSVMQTIEDVKELYIRSCEEKRSLEERIKLLTTEKEDAVRNTEERMRNEFTDALQRVRPMWETEMMKTVEEQLQQDIKKMREQWAAEKEAEITERISAAEAEIQKKLHEQYTQALQQERDKLCVANNGPVKQPGLDLEQGGGRNEQDRLHCAVLELEMTWKKKMESLEQESKREQLRLNEQLEECKKELNISRAEHAEKVTAFNERETMLKNKLIKFQKKLKIVEKQHNDELISSEKIHAEKLASLESQLRQLSERCSENAVRQHQVCQAQVLDRWTGWFQSCLNSIYGDVCAYAEKVQSTRDAEVHEALKNYHKFLLSKVNFSCSTTTNHLTNGKPYRAQAQAGGVFQFPLSKTAQDKLHASGMKRTRCERPDRQSDTRCSNKTSLRPLHHSSKSATDLSSIPNSCAKLTHKLHELNLSDVSDGSVFHLPPSAAVV
ncbi:centrosomal protein of 152 kDa-like [Ornithodoros turicata]|uniref:centrosomal protein of 152 kDa-like n=1 Tax=Ornithodoros turicata TaxID=34597 RepID=UPI003138A8C8